MEVRIAIATTKEYWMPKDDMYIPLQVGAEGKPFLGYARDDIGENISRKNSTYCELTGLYWMWKHSDADYIGLVHYRRHFGKPNAKLPVFCKRKRVANQKSIEKILQNTDIILPMKRRYYIESMYTHYAHSHYEKHINATQKVIAELCPEYLDAFGRVLRRTNGHMFNMLIMKREKLDEYCRWLFPILEKLEQTIDTSGYDAFQKRYLGRVAELILDVWIEHNGYAYWELPVVTLGHVHWFRKIRAFLGAKIFGIRYTKSF